MADTNYISSIVRILETPKHVSLKKAILVTEFRVQLPQIRNTKIVNLIFWGNLARDVTDSYKVNDYILIEGYISLLNKQGSTKLKKRVFTKAEIVVLKVYPFLLNQDR